MGAAPGDAAADGGQVMAFHVLSILARGSEPCGRSPVLRDERFVSRLFVGFSQPSPKQLHHDFAHLTPFDGALRLDAPIQDIRNLNGCFHLAKVTVFPYSRQESILPQYSQSSSALARQAVARRAKAGRRSRPPDGEDSVDDYGDDYGGRRREPGSPPLALSSPGPSRAEGCAGESGSSAAPSRGQRRAREVAD